MTTHTAAPSLTTFAELAAAAPDSAAARAALATVVEALEQRAAASSGARELGDAALDPLVVLQRRFGRAHQALSPDGREPALTPVETKILRAAARNLRLQAAQSSPARHTPWASHVRTGHEVLTPAESMHATSAQ